MRELPVGKAFRHVLASTLNNFRFALFAQWPWLAILAVALLAMHASTGILGLSEEEFSNIMKQNPALASRIGGWMIALFIIAMIGFSSVAVNWHRYILADELPRGLSKLRVDGLVLRYLGNLLLISLFAGILLVPIFAAAIVLMSEFWFVPMFVVLFAVLGPIIYRWSVKLPAVALGRKDFGLNDAWKVTEGNWWRIVAISLLLTGVSWIAGLALLGVSRALQLILPANIASYADLVVQVGVNWMLMILGITLLTSLYGFFVEGRDF